MRNLNRSTEKAARPKLNAVTSVSSKVLYSLCAVLFLLICSLSTKASRYHRYHMYHYGYGFYYGSISGTGASRTDPFILDPLGFGSGDVDNIASYAQTGSSPHSNLEGGFGSGNDHYIQITLDDDGYLSIFGGTSDFDSVFYLYDSSWTLITSGDDGYGSGDSTHLALQPGIQEYLNAGTYYLRVDGTDKYGDPTSGDMSIDYWLQ